MLGRMVRLHLARDPGLTLDWTSRREEPGALVFQAESPRALLDLTRERGRYDYAINCIAVLKNAAENSGPKGAAVAHQINAVFPHELAGIAAEIDCKLVHVSTDGVFAPDSGVCLESDVPAPADLYGRTKLLGEPSASNTITFRCSFIGPNPVKKTGLFEWVVGQPHQATIAGYDDQLWRGVTTLQFAKLCARIFREDLFVRLREQFAVHHFCPNVALTKYQLLQLISRRFRPDLQVDRAMGGPSNRVLDTRGMLREICGAERPMDVAIEELSTYIDGPKAAGA
jgi:dTDP-4-dehydrorhamnose reductase